MALIYDKIVESTTEPSPNDLWLKDGKLMQFKGGWKEVSIGNTAKFSDVSSYEEWSVDGEEFIDTNYDPTKRYYIVVDDTAAKSPDMKLLYKNSSYDYLQEYTFSLDSTSHLYIQPLGPDAFHVTYCDLAGNTLPYPFFTGKFVGIASDGEVIVDIKKTEFAI